MIVPDHTGAVLLANAYVWGRFHGTVGDSFGVNPYPPGPEWQEWQRGWRDGVGAVIRALRALRGQAC